MTNDTPTSTPTAETETAPAYLTRTPTLAELIEREGVTLTFTGPKLTPQGTDPGWPQAHNSYQVTLRRAGERATFAWHQGLGITEDPGVELVMDSLISDAVYGRMGLAEFVDELGINLDDEHESERAARKTWRACQAIETKIMRLLGGDDELFEAFAYSDRD